MVCFEAVLIKQSTLELRWRQMADCSRGGFQPPEMQDRWRWTAVYVGSLAAKKMTTEDSGGWNRRRAGCSRKDTVAPDHAGIGKRAQPAWNRCVLETTTSECLAALVWHAYTEKIDVSVWRRRWAPTEGDRAGTQEDLQCFVAVIEMWLNQIHDQWMERRVGHWTSDAVELL